MPLYIIKEAADPNTGSGFLSIILITEKLELAVTEYVMRLLAVSSSGRELRRQTGDARKLTLAEHVKAMWDFAYNTEDRTSPERDFANLIHWQLEDDINDDGDYIDLIEIIKPNDQLLTEADNICYRLMFCRKTNQITLTGYSSVTACPTERQIDSVFLKQMNQLWTQQRELHQSQSTN